MAVGSVSPPGLFGRHTMARWPRRTWTTLLTYAIIFVGFPLLCLLAYAWVQGWF